MAFTFIFLLICYLPINLVSGKGGILTNKLTQAILSGVAFLIVWLMLAILFGATITDTLLTAFIVALVFGAGIYSFGPRRDS